MTLQRARLNQAIQKAAAARHRVAQERAALERMIEQQRNTIRNELCDTQSCF